MKKRVLAMFLALVMCLALLPAAAVAADSNLPKLGDPSNLRWDPEKTGTVRWEINGNFQDRVRLRLYKVGTEKPVHERYINFSGSRPDRNSFSSDSFALECAGSLVWDAEKPLKVDRGDWDSGDYYFTVQCIGDNIQYIDGNEVSSQNMENGIYSYVKPEAKLPTPSQAGTWNWPATIWDDEQDSNNQIKTYYISYGFSEKKVDPSTEADSILEIGGSSRSRSGESDSWLQERLIGEHGNGFYYFRIRPLSSNIEQIRNGNFSPWSEGYNLTEASNRVKDQLTGFGGSPADTVLQDIQKLNKTELQNAMVSDLKNEQNGTITAMKALEDKVGGPAKVAVDEKIAGIFEQDEISVVGASLNKEKSTDPEVTLKVGRAEPKDIREELYNSTVAVNFSMDLENVKDTNNLAVPVKITMPIPANINPDFLVILHYHENGQVETVHTNCYKENGQWYVSFVLTSFSDFVMTQTKSAPAPVTPDQPAAPEVIDIPATGTAVASTQSVLLDGKKVEFQMYAIIDSNGGENNFIKLRDLAQLLNSTKAHFNAGWDEASDRVTITSNTAYVPNGSEGSVPFSGNRAYRKDTAPVRFDGKDVPMTAFKLTDDQGGDYTYYRLRDLGQLLNFNVGWSEAKGVFVETDKPYNPND